jgi:hypothetical protein
MEYTYKKFIYHNTENDEIELEVEFIANLKWRPTSNDPSCEWDWEIDNITWDKDNHDNCGNFYITQHLENVDNYNNLFDEIYNDMREDKNDYGSIYR